MREESVDVCIVGSGGGGAVLAYEAARRGLRTLVLERGPFVPPAAMTHDELSMIPLLYREGGLQMSREMNLFILQGSCVGGSTVLANLVLMRAPAAVLSAWRALGAEIDTVALDEAYSLVERALGGGAAPPPHVSRASQLFREGASSLGYEPRWMRKALGACVGCGSCNLGCPSGTKRSALTTYIPAALRHGARVLADTEVGAIVHRRGQVHHLEARGPDGPLRVRARHVVVAAGPIGSSALLLRSGVRRNVGQRLAFNAGAVVCADFPEPLDAFAADPMSVYVETPDALLEVTHGPPLVAALTTPGWLSDHAERMSRYRHLAFAGALIATAPSATMRRWPGLGASDTVSFRPGPDELGRLRRGLSAIARIFLAAGATRVHLPTPRTAPVTRPEDLTILDRALRSAHDVPLGSSHPQGGNALSDDTALGVVDSDFRVHGFANLHVCDASVFPTGLGVNPLLTVMALAHYAAPRILGRAPALAGLRLPRFTPADFLS